MKKELFDSIIDKEKVASIGKLFRIVKILVIIIIVLLIAILILGGNRTYVGGVSGTVKAYTQDDSGKLTCIGSIPRGIKIEDIGRKVTDKASDTELVEIVISDEAAEQLAINATALELEQTNNSSGDDIKSSELINTFLIDSANVVKGKKNIVQETELYVRTPVTIYKNNEGTEIASYMKKGSSLEIIEIGQLQDNGYIDMYQVAYKDASGAEGKGYVYGKYVVGTKEEAEENYNQNGEYDAACKAEYGFDLGGGHAKNLDYFPVEKPAFEDNELCTNARTMYINKLAAINNDSYIKLIEETDCNAVVIDIKDGQLSYKSEVAKEASPTSYKNAYTSEEKFKKGVKAYADTGVYTIGRIVVFNDSEYAKDHPEDCISTGGNSVGWPSAYSRDVWEYNVNLATEAVEKFGFDEIQFDYVRFPEASYEMSKSGGTDFRNIYGEEKAQAIQGFCYYACDKLHEAGAYVSVDVFGECSYTYVTAYGQYWPAISNVVDAISSMPYSDHHGKNDTWTNPYKTLNAWAKRTADRQKEIPTPAVDRTWITGYNTPYWNPTVSYDTAKMKEQIKALTDAGLKGGFIPWNVLSDIEKYRSYKDIWNEQ